MSKNFPKPIYITGHPIEIAEHDTFTVTVTPADLKAMLYIYNYLNDATGRVIPWIKLPCQCEMAVLMSRGCQCGGA